MNSSFNIEKLTSLLRDFYTVTQIHITVFNEAFQKIASYPKETVPFCRLIRTDSTARSMCDRCHRDALLTAAYRQKTHIYQCHAGLKEAIVPICLGSVVVGYLFFEHMLAYDSHEESWKMIEEKCAGYQIKMPELKTACLKQPLMKEDSILSAANLMQIIASHLCMERLASLRRDDLPVRIDNYIQERLAENINAEDICAHFQIEKTRLCKIAKESYGTGIAEYIRCQRIEMAKQLLQDSPELGISEIAARCGFHNYNYFLTAFRKATGKSPKEFTRA